ncbi:MAG: hypothetical protein DCC56_02345 [Anaerolineae bacterium]|nr:MAG: hypothetical protein DCC56_02345 [Anaerolineae bacterium]
MDEMNRYSLLMEAYAELQPEIESARKLTTIVANPPLSKVLEGLGAMPPEGLFMGMASDGLPMLLNLHDAVPGPLLVAGDAGAGKTDLLQIIARAAGITHTPNALQFGVMTNHPEEWNGFERIPNSAGIYPLYADSSQEFLLTLVAWARGSKTESQSVLLLLDDLEAATNLDFEARQTLRWLFLRGPARRVWPIVTLNANRCEAIQPWLEAFHTRIFGSIKDDRRAQQLMANGADLPTLNNNAKFTLREGNHWLRFWLPSLD